MGRKSRSTAPIRKRPGQLDKAVNPGLVRAFNDGPKGLEPRRVGLADAINIATSTEITRPDMPWGFHTLPRSPYNDGPFGPGNPLIPVPIDRLRDDTGRPEPRIWDYPSQWNLPGNTHRPVPWQVLRHGADGIDIIRRCIGIRQKHVSTLKWSWSVRSTVVEEAYNADRSRGYDDIASKLREQYAAEIKRLTRFWENPWPSQGWTFRQWINAVMEEHLVFDAVVVYPRMSLRGDLLDFELVDGSTIKPLLDERGARPQPPHPAYQQELHGFPRGEWAASGTRDEHGNTIVDNGFAASEMYYYRGNTRLHSPYGFSPVEQALISARLYLKRQGWLLAEYDDGSTPLTVWEVPESVDGSRMTPEQRRVWEQSINEELGGQTAARHRMRVGVPGWTAKQLTSMDQQYKPDFDLFLIKLVAGFIGVTATEAGFSETTGLGSAGWQEGQAEVGGRVGLRPDTECLSELVNGISCQFANCPPELEFSFIDPASQNDTESDQVADSQFKRGTIVLNDDRRRLKLPLYGFPEADMPMLVGVGPAGYVFLDGAKTAADVAAAAATAKQQAEAEGATGKLEIEQAKLDDGKAAREEDREFSRENRDSEHDFAREQATVSKAAKPDQPPTAAVTLIPAADVQTGAAEVAAFRTWRRRNPTPKRPFTFKSATPDGWPELAMLTPDVADFGDGWEWLTDLDKMTWLDWNLANPNKPKGPDGRWVKAGGGPLSAALKAMHRPRPILADADIRAMSDDHLFDLFAELSQHDTVDEPLMRRLVDDMDRRERAIPIPALHDDAMTAEQRRVDTLVASGRDYLSAYAEVHGGDDRRLTEEAHASGVDRKPGEGLHVAVRRSYDEWLHVAYLQAENATRGNMLNRAGKAAGIDPLHLFTGPVSRVRRYASEELMRWWAHNQRLNFTQFRAQMLGRSGDVAAAERTRLLSNDKDFI